MDVPVAANAASIFQLVTKKLGLAPQCGGLEQELNPYSSITRYCQAKRWCIAIFALITYLSEEMQFCTCSGYIQYNKNTPPPLKHVSTSNERNLKALQSSFRTALVSYDSTNTLCLEAGTVYIELTRYKHLKSVTKSPTIFFARAGCGGGFVKRL